jgi:hypothetical protein
MGTWPHGGITESVERQIGRKDEVTVQEIYRGVNRDFPGVLRHSVRSALNRGIALGRYERIGRGRYRRK